MNQNTRFLLQKGVESLSAGSFASAKLYFAQAVKNEPKNSEANRLFGVCVHFLGDNALAMECFDEAIRLDPKNSHAYNNKATLQSELGFYDESIQNFRKAIKFDNKNFEALNNLANTLQELKRYDDAIFYYREALKINPEFLDALNNLGNTYHELKHYDDAIESYQQSLKINPKYAEAYSNLGNTLHALRHYDQALSYYQNAIRLNPKSGKNYSRLGKYYIDKGDWNSAVECFILATNLEPNYPEAHLNLGCAYLEKFDFKNGWPEYEWRTKVGGHKNHFSLSTKKEWNGIDDELKLFIFGEQGIGDQILHGSILKELEKAKLKITVALDKKIIPIFKRSFPNYIFVDKNEFYSEDKYDRYILLGSLGKFFKNSADDFIKNAPYLFASNERKELLEKELQGCIYPVGLSWKSSNAEVGLQKSLNLDDLLPLLQSLKSSFVNLQYGDTDSELHLISDKSGISIKTVQSIDLFNDIDGLATLIDCCSFVVTSSNTTAHLSGALGKTTFLLLPFAAGKFWYWHSINQQSIWYPSVKVFQQEAEGNWNAPISKLKIFLENYIAKKN